MKLLSCLYLIISCKYQCCYVQLSLCQWFCSVYLILLLVFMPSPQIFIDWAEGTYKETPTTSNNRKSPAICTGKPLATNAYVSIYLLLSAKTARSYSGNEFENPIMHTHTHTIAWGFTSQISMSIAYSL